MRDDVSREIRLSNRQRELLARFEAGERAALARLISMVENEREAAAALLDALHPRLGRAHRIGITGPPGAGKSTMTAALVAGYRRAGEQVAVIAVDPTSPFTGGALLGDRIRMNELATDPGVFIRSMASRGALGGLALATKEVADVLDAFGFDRILIETVGVGQSETVVAEMTDLFVLLIAPAGGDELQGVKRGIMEMADMILVNKADGDLKPMAERTRSDYAGALRLLRKRPYDPEGFPKVMLVSALKEEGLAAAWDQMRDLIDWRRESGHFDARRAEQARYWFREEVRQGLLARLETAQARAAMEQAAEEVAEGRATPANAARDLLTRLGG